MAKIKATAKLIENVRTIADNSRTHSIVLDLGTGKGGDECRTYSVGVGSHGPS